MTAPNPPSAGDFLLGSGAKGKSAKFPSIGSSITGTITRAPEVKQQVDPDTNKLDTWEDGSPKWQIVVTLQTDQRSPEIENDDGLRFLYVRGSRKPESLSLHAAVAGAVQAAGADGLEVGGVLTVTYTGDGVKPSPTKTAPKQYGASYVPAANAALMAPPQAQPVAQPVQQYTPPAAAPQPVAQPVAAGPDPALLAAIAHLPEAQQKAVLAAPAMTAEMAAAMFPKAS